MRKSIRTIMTLCGAAMIVASCDFLEVPIESNITTSNFFQTTSDFDMALTGVYQTFGSVEWDAQHRFGDYFYGFMYWGRIGTDEAFVTAGNYGEDAIGNYTYTPEHLFVSKVWFMQYLGIQRANVVINRLNAYTGSNISDTDKHRILGEAYFLRGWFYFQLARYYGEVPLVLEETTDINALDTSKRPLSEVYAQVISDYEMAEQLLPEVNSTGRAHKYAATALKARAYLQMAGEPMNDSNAASLCAQACRDVINSGRFALVEDYFSQFDGLHEHNSEYIFDVEFDNTANNSLYGGQVGTIEGVPHVRAVYWTQMVTTPVMYNKFEDGDLRRGAVVHGGSIELDANGNEVLVYDNPSYTTMYFIYKFRHAMSPEERGSSWTNWNNAINFPIIRYADVLLMLAEAEYRASGTPSSEAIEYLNQVRRRGYGVDIDTPNSAVDYNAATDGAFGDFILEERSRELCFEGHRWADLVRFGKLGDGYRALSSDASWELTPAVQQMCNPSNFNEKHNIFPIPQDVIDASNGAIQQNPVWN